MKKVILFSIVCVFSVFVLFASKGDFVLGSSSSGQNMMALSALPTVTTTNPTSISTTSSNLGGEVTNDGGATVTERGVVYSTSPYPTTANNKVQMGSGTGSYSQSVSGLSPGTHYYVRAYAINSEGTAYGEQRSFTTNVSVSSIVRHNPTGSISNSNLVTYQVNFTGPVSGLSVVNFSLTTSGISGLSITNVSGIGTSYLVSVNTGSGDGWLRLNLSNSTGVSPNISGLPFTGEIYTIDKTPPTVSITSDETSPTNANPIPLKIDFSESVTGFVISDITISGGTLSNFNGSGANYAVDVTPVGRGTITVNVNAGVSSDAAGNGNTAASPFSIIYPIPSDNANLSNLVLSEGTLSPSFDAGTINYTASVGNEGTSIMVTPTVEDAQATVTVNGTMVTSGQASGLISLNVGPNMIPVVVTAEDGTTKTYTVTVMRAASSNANLSNLVLSEGTLSPSFDAGTTSYTASVENEVTSLTVTPTVDDVNATVTVNGTMVTSGQDSGSISLSVGFNMISVVVTAEDGAMKTYTITVTVNALVNAESPTINLQPSGVTVTEGAANPTLSVGASVNDGGNLTYQWYRSSTNSTTEGTAIAGAISVSYTAPTDTAGTVYYYVVITNNNNDVNGEKTASVTSNVVGVTVSSSAAAPTTGGGSATPLEPTNVSRSISPLQGGELSFQGATVTIPPNAFGGSLTLMMRKLGSINNEWQPGNATLVSDVFEITKDKEGLFDKLVTIKIPFNKEKVNLESHDFAVYWLNETNNEWVQLDNIQVDWNNGTVSGQTDHFTKFVVLATEKQPIVYLTDIKRHWAEENIIKFVGMGVIKGYPNGTFRPNNSITRAEFATILVRALDLRGTNQSPFNDTRNHWANEAIATAYSNGIIQGYEDGTFRPNDLITREQMAAMIVNAFKLEGSTMRTFKDQSTISPWAIGSIKIATEHGIIHGYRDETVRPKNIATRAEAVTVIERALEKE